jgi:hypothetical protein
MDTNTLFEIQMESYEYKCCPEFKFNIYRISHKSPARKKKDLHRLKPGP